VKNIKYAADAAACDISLYICILYKILFKINVSTIFMLNLYIKPFIFFICRYTRISGVGGGQTTWTLPPGYMPDYGVYSAVAATHIVNRPAD